MKHMNPKLARLLNEGFSINTLEKLTSKQIGVLYSKINEAPGSVKMAADKADPAKIKTLTDQGINVEIGENEEEDADVLLSVTLLLLLLLLLLVVVLLVEVCVLFFKSSSMSSNRR